MSELQALAAIHGVVLHPHKPEPWVLHPFSLTPTLNFVETPHASWWAPCIWCGFGIAVLVGGPVTIHSRFGAERDVIEIPVIDGQPVDSTDISVHFAIRPSRAWDNVHQHCSFVLPFRATDQIQPWCDRHGIPYGEAVPLNQVAQLATLWYGSHASPDWHKWTISEAQKIFHDAGLRSEFWDVGGKPGRF
ncbi:MAG TPA: organomercurial lyase [Acidobacteriaceae bacterium]|nr:organomercurial lyase [Acidobacteriaceae bacterium]